MMKMSAISLFILSQCILISNTAHAADLLTPTTQNTFENTLAQTITTLAQDKQNAPAILASNYSSQTLAHYLNQYGHASVSLNFSQKGHLDSADVNFLKPIQNTQKNVFFYQLSYHRPEQRNIFSAGLGDRHFFDHQNALYGIDGFIDADTKGNLRASVGSELYFDYARFDANYYLPLSQWKQVEGTKYYQARPARGFDVRFKGYLPEYPAIATTLDYSKYYGHVGVFNDNTQENNPSVFSYGLIYRPIQLISFSAEHQQATGDQSQNAFGLHLHYQLGVPLNDQLHTMPVTYGQLGEERYAFVQRNYTMPMAYREIDHLSVTFQGGVVSNGSEIFPSIDANHRIVAIRWTGTWAKYLNSDSTLDPIFTTLPKNATHGTLTITVIDSEGKEATATAPLTQIIQNDISHIKTLAITKVSSNSEAFAYVQGTTQPNVKVTLTFPDGTHRVVMANKAGVFRATSKYAWIQRGEITATAGKLTSKKAFTPSVVGQYEQELGLTVFGCFTYAHFHAPVGSSVKLMFSNGISVSEKVTSNNQVDIFPGYSYLPSGPLKAYLITKGHQSAPIEANFTQNYAPGIGLNRVQKQGKSTYVIHYWVAPSAIPYTATFSLDGVTKVIQESAQAPSQLGQWQKYYHTWQGMSGEPSQLINKEVTIQVPNDIQTQYAKLRITSTTNRLSAMMTAFFQAKDGSLTGGPSSVFSGNTPLSLAYEGKVHTTQLLSPLNG